MEITKRQLEDMIRNAVKSNPQTTRDNSVEVTRQELDEYIHKRVNTAVQAIAPFGLAHHREEFVQALEGTAGRSQRVEEDKAPLLTALAGYLRAQFFHGGRPASMQEVVEILRTNDQVGHTPRDQAFAHKVERALEWLDPAGAGAFTPEILSMTFVPLLNSKAVVRRAAQELGGIIEDMDHGNLAFARQTAPSAPAYIAAEGDTVPYSQGTYDQLPLVAKRLGGIVAVSNDSLRYALGNFLEMVVNDLVTQAALVEDVAFLRGDGTGGQPAGIKEIVDTVAAGNVLTASTNTTPYLAMEENMMNLRTRIAEENGNLDALAFFMAPRPLGSMLGARMHDANGSGSGSYAFEELRMNGTFLGHPVYDTAQLPTNLGGGTETEIYGVCMDSVAIGNGRMLELLITKTGVYNDGSDKSTFNRDESAVRVIHSSDINLSHPLAAAYVPGVTY